MQIFGRQLNAKRATNTTVRNFLEKSNTDKLTGELTGAHFRLVNVAN